MVTRAQWSLGCTASKAYRRVMNSSIRAGKAEHPNNAVQQSPEEKLSQEYDTQGFIQ